MTNLLFIVLAGLVVTQCVGANPVPFIEKCKEDDRKCLKESAQATIPVYVLGVPEFNIDSLDPIHIKIVDASSPGLKLIVTDTTVTGLRTCHIKSMTRDVAKNTLGAKALCDVNVDGHYEMDGNLLVLSLKGKGQLHAKIKKMQINIDMALEEKVGKDGKKHWNVKSWKHSYDLKDKVDVEFENLFKENDVLGRVARELISSSGKDIVNEVGPPVIRNVVDQIVHNIDRFFKTVPLEDLVEN